MLQIFDFRMLRYHEINPESSNLLSSPNKSFEWDFCSKKMTDLDEINGAVGIFAQSKQAGWLELLLKKK